MSNSQSRLEAARLYAITPDAPPSRVLELATSVLAGGADVLQLRHKTLARGDLLELACRLRELTARAGALLVVNDHVDIAILAEADGVHLGADDIPVADARRVTPAGFVIGASASTPAAARHAVAAGASYLGAGPAFPTPIKAAKPAIGAAGVAAVQAAVAVPVFAIGGIQGSNAAELVAVGVRRACVIRGVFEAADPARATAEMRAVLAG